MVSYKNQYKEIIVKPPEITSLVPTDC